MKVFISWSGRRSKMVALALREWLPLMFETIDPWMSSTDIDKGMRWAEQISRELEHSDVGVVCVTPENIDNPWLLFETGAITKKVSASLVCTLVIGMQKSSINGPLAQFQHTELEEKDLLQFVHTLNQAKEPPRRSELEIRRLFDKLWPLLKEELVGVPRQSPETEQSTAEQLQRYRQEATEIKLEVSPGSADLFFNDRLLGPSPQLIRVNPDASVNTVSAAAANHFDFHSVISEEDFKSRAISITLEHKTTTVPESKPLADRDWQTHVLRWLRDRRRYSENPVLTRATVTYLSLIGEHDEAVAEAESALKLAPEWYMTHNAMGYALVGKGEVKRAIDCFRTTAAMKPDNYLGHYNLAAAFSLQKDYLQCIDNLERILDPTVLNTFSDAKQDIENDRDFNNIREDAEFQRRFADVCDKIKRAMNEDG